MKFLHKVIPLIAVGLLATPLAVMADNAGKSDLKAGFQDGWREGRIETAYLFSESLSAFDIDVEVNGNTAVLTGKVGSDVQKDLAEAMAKGVDGIETVDNRLVVEEAASDQQRDPGDKFASYVRDVTTTARIKSQLITQVPADAVRINVDTRDGNVSLKGTVQSDEVKELAEQIAENTDSVRSVDNQLEVESPS